MVEVVGEPLQLQCVRSRERGGVSSDDGHGRIQPVVLAAANPSISGQGRGRGSKGREWSSWGGGSQPLPTS